MASCPRVYGPDYSSAKTGPGERSRVGTRPSRGPHGGGALPSQPLFPGPIPGETENRISLKAAHVNHEKKTRAESSTISHLPSALVQKPIVSVPSALCPQSSSWSGEKLCGGGEGKKTPRAECALDVRRHAPSSGVQSEQSQNSDLKPTHIPPKRFSPRYSVARLSTGLCAAVAGQTPEQKRVHAG